VSHQESNSPSENAGIGKIVVLCGSFPPMPCGVGDSAFELATELSSRGMEIEVVADVTAAEIKKGDGPFVVHPVIDNWGMSGTGKLAKFIQSLEPNILHIHYPSVAYGRGLAIPLLTTRLKSRQPNFRIVLTLHEFRLAHHFRKLASFLLMDPCDAVIMPCPLELNALIRRHKSVEEKIHAAIPGGAVGPDPDEFSPEQKLELRRKIRVGWGVGDDDVVLLHYGTPTRSKGIEDLFKALRLIKPEGVEPKLFIAGDFRPYEVEFHKTISGQPGGLGVAEQVRWLGRKSIDDLPGFFLAADVGVFPFLDGFSFRRTSLIGMLMWDIPIITTKPYGELEEIKEQEKIRFVDPGKPKSLATGLITLIANPKALQVAKEVANPLKKYFKWDLIADKYTKVYREMLDI